jgi:hypothetical protein
LLNIILFFINLIQEHTLWLYGACVLLILLQLHAFLSARHDRHNTIFTIEREVAAHREGRAMSGIGALLGIMVVITALKYYVVPSIDVHELVEPTPTLTLVMVPTREPTFTPTPDVTVTPTRRATATPAPALPTATISAPTAAPPPACPDPNTRITSPGMDAVVLGRIQIRGSADHARFQFYKVELGVGPDPRDWHSISDIHRVPVQGGVLDEFDTANVPNGVYWFKLTVVDVTSNFPDPCAVRVTIRN